MAAETQQKEAALAASEAGKAERAVAKTAERAARSAGKDWVGRIREAKGPSRKFVQTWDFAINLKGMDLKKPENRFSAEVVLPEGRGKELKVAVIGDAIAAEAKQSGADLVIEKAQIEQLARDHKQLKRIAAEYDWILAEVALMALVGKALGAVLGPRGRIPKPIPPKIPVKPLVERAKKTVRVVVKDAPVIHVSIGTEAMSEEQVARNAEAVYDLVKEKLPKGLQNIKSLYVKLTMGKPVKLEAL